MLIESYDLEMVSPPCDPGSERWAAFARFGQDISAVLPFLNALWPGAVYDHESQILTLVRGGRRCTLRAHEVAVGNLEDREEGRRVLDGLIAEINQVWERRQAIVPNYERRRRPTALEVYRLLPGGNCKRCGEPTCFVFAAKLVAGQTGLARCERLSEPAFAAQRDALEQMIGPAAS